MYTVKVEGFEFQITENKIPLYEIGFLLEASGGRLLKSFEVHRLKAKGFPFYELEFAGKFWTATRVSCSLNCAWEIFETGEIEPVAGGWDKTFRAWGVFLLSPKAIKW